MLVFGEVRARAGVRWFSAGRICGENSPVTHITSSIANIQKSIVGKTRQRKKIIKELHGDVVLKDYPTIFKESKKRFSDSHLAPTSLWINKISRELKLEGDPIKDVLKSTLKLQDYNIKPIELFGSLDVGDVVELSTSLNQSSLAVILQVPPNESDPRFTVMDKQGELYWLEKSAIKFRIPKLIPKEWLNGIVHRVADDEAEHGSIKTTTNGFQKFSVNPLARHLIVEPLVNITNRSWDGIQENSRKLELIHRILQSDGPREVSFFTLLKALKSINLEQSKELFASNKRIEDSYRKSSEILSEKLGNEFNLQYGESILGREFESLNSTKTFDASFFYSLALALRKQSRLWSTNYCSTATLVPLSVTVLPIRYSDKIDKIASEIKLDSANSNILKKFLKLKDYSNITPALESIFFLFKEYAVGNISDAKSITVICQLLKPHIKGDITKSSVYDLLTKVGYIDPHLTNPLHFSTSLCLPNTKVSNKATLEQLYIDNIDVTKERDDDLAKSRTDYSDLRVYCIDSADAHEIDDGVSLKKLDSDNYILYIHVADPSSYMKKDSILTKIAYERASTIYQPEIVVPMLPKSLADLAGLGIDKKKTRALTFSIPYNKRLNKLDMEKSKIEATYLSNFPKYTYNDVNSVLDNLDSKNPEHEELSELFEISKKLRNERIKNGAVIFGESMNKQIKVSPKFENDDFESKPDIDAAINIQAESNSVILVSELMILGNKVAANILSKNNINGIYKGMEKLSLSAKTTTFVEQLNNELIKSSKLPSLSEIVKLFKFLSPAYYTSHQRKHLMLGIDGYAPSTSPLRRFGDLINHFGFHNYLNKEESFFSEDEVFSISLHMESKNDILKKANRRSTAYYLIQELEKNRKTGNFIVSSRSYGGFVLGFLQDYGIVAKLKLLRNKKPPLIGEVLTNFEILETDKVGQNVILKEL